MVDYYINGRFLNQAVTGVQRYGATVISALQPTEEQVLFPSQKSTLAGVLWEQRKLPQLLHGHGNPLLLNFCNTAPHSYPRQIVTIHDAAIFDHPSWFSRRFSAYYRWLLPRLASGALHVVTVSAFSKQSLQGHLQIPDDKISVIKPIPDEALLQTSPVQVPGVKPPFVLLVGSFDPRKRLPESIVELQSDAAFNGMQILVVGRNHRAFSHSAHPNHEAGVTYLKNTGDGMLRWLYEHAAMVVAPSAYEGFGLVPYEALHFGARVIASDIPAHRENLGDHVVYFNLDERGAMGRAARESLARPEPTAFTSGNINELRDQWQGLINDLL